MGNKKLSAVMGVPVPQIILLVTDNYPYDEKTAANEFYASMVYDALWGEETKLSHFSLLTLFNMLDEEKKTGSFTFQEEA